MTPGIRIVDSFIVARSSATDRPFSKCHVFRWIAKKIFNGTFFVTTLYRGSSMGPNVFEKLVKGEIMCAFEISDDEECIDKSSVVRIVWKGVIKCDKFLNESTDWKAWRKTIKRTYILETIYTYLSPLELILVLRKERSLRFNEQHTTTNFPLDPFDANSMVHVRTSCNRIYRARFSNARGRSPHLHRSICKHSN